MNQHEQNSQPRLFINYRTEDTGPSASRLYTELERQLQPGQIFLDHEEIYAGADWSESLLQEIERATVMFVLIGQKWLMIHDRETGDRRLNLPEDWVRKEIEIALRRNIPIIPILVEDAPPLTERALQTVPSIAPLAKFQCLPLRRKDWKSDFQRLLQLLFVRGFKSHLTTDAASSNSALVCIVIDRVIPFRENRFGRYTVYGTTELADGVTAYGEGLILQLTLENRSDSDIVIPTIDIFIEDYDSHPIEVYDYSALQAPGTHLEIPGTSLQEPVQLTEQEHSGGSIPVTSSRLFLSPIGNATSQHTLNFTVVARAPGIWSFRVIATYVDSLNPAHQSIESDLLHIVKR